MQYKGYKAKIDFDEDDNMLRGEVIGLRDFIIFEGKSIDEIQKSFHTAVDDYLEYCKSRGEKPDKPYSGNFLVRVGQSLHCQISCQAQREGKSLNAWICGKLANALEVALIDGGSNGAPTRAVRAPIPVAPRTHTHQN